MPTVKKKSALTVIAYRGDAKTLLAFDLPAAEVKGLAGFSIRVRPYGQPAYYLLNKLVLPSGPSHAVIAGEPADSTANAPIQKFRWVHVPGSFHQGSEVYYGSYTYTVTPRYFDSKGALKPLDPGLGHSIRVVVKPYAEGHLKLSFTRGFVQSQAFAAHFGNKALIRPAGHTLLYDTSQPAGVNPSGQSFTFQQEYAWSGFTARQGIFDLLHKVTADPSYSIDVFAYDLDEPDIISIFLQLAAQGRIRMIADNASLHHNAAGTRPEDQVQKLFQQAAKPPAAILRGKFGRFAHDKIIIVYKKGVPRAVLTGSTNFSVTGIYVNANHTLLFEDPEVAALYASVFNEAWNDKASESFNQSSLAAAPSSFHKKGLPRLSITFSPHLPQVAGSILDSISSRIKAETSSVLFAVMDVSDGGGSVFPALQQVHTNQKIFSYGISDSPGQALTLYKPGSSQGVLVSGKPGQTLLPPPFDKQESIGADHEIHHKFVVCGFNTASATVWCGSSNLALGGESENGDNLLRIDDRGVAAVFAIEALALVDHFDFLDAHSQPRANGGTPPAPAGTPAPATPPAADLPPMLSADPADTLKLHGDDSWVKKYYDPADLYYKDRKLFSKRQD